MLLLKLVLGLIIFFIIYKEVIKGRGTPNLNMNVWKILNFIGWMIFLIVIPMKFFPGFWNRYYNSDIFWISILLIAFAAFMYSYHSYTRWLTAIIIMVVLILYNFGDFKSNTKKGLASGSQDVHVTITDNIRNERHYITLTQSKPYWQGLIDMANFNITPDCGKNIVVSAYNWDRSYPLYGCTQGQINLPRYQKWIRISIL